MLFDEYQKLARSTAIYPDQGRNLWYPTLGLCGESGEVAEITKKVYRDRMGRIDEEAYAKMTKELGDVLWYAANIACEMGLSLDTIAEMNIEKLASRRERGVLHGDGSDR